MMDGLTATARHDRWGEPLVNHPGRTRVSVNLFELDSTKPRRTWRGLETETLRREIVAIRRMVYIETPIRRQ